MADVLFGKRTKVKNLQLQIPRIKQPVCLKMQTKYNDTSSVFKTLFIFVAIFKFLMKKIVFIIAILLQCTFSNSAFATLYKYYFYPEVNTYYDVSGKRWVFKQDDFWVRNVSMPEGIERLGQRVTVWSDSKEIWYENHIHVAKYENGDYEPTWTRIKETFPIPKESVPNVGSCRYWFPEKKDNEQPAESSNCDELRNKAPLGVWVLSRTCKNIMKIEKYSSAAPGVVRQQRYYYIK